AARQVELVLGLHHVGDATLAGLRVDPDDRLVAAAHVVRVDGQVRHGPRVLGERDARALGFGLEGLEALLDAVLVGAGERGVDQVARVRVAGVDRQLVAVLDGTTDLIDVGEAGHGGWRMTSRPGPGCQTSMTPSQTSRAKSSSVSMKISGEYS